MPDPQPESGYALLTLTIAERAPLLTDPRWARTVRAALDEIRAEAPGRLWAAEVTPCALRMVVGPGDADAFSTWVARVKTVTAAALLATIRCAEDQAATAALDAVLRFSPVWGGAIYRVWQDGHHRARLWSARRLSATIAGLSG